MAKRWTKEEKDFLEKYYKTHGIKYCQKYLNRSYESINRKALKLNLRIVRLWSEKEEQFLKENYDSKTHKNNKYKHIAEKLNRSVKSVTSKCFELGLGNRTCVNYSIEEEDFIIKNYTKKGSAYCAEHLNRSQGSITSKVNALRREKGIHIDKSKVVSTAKYQTYKGIPAGTWNSMDRRAKKGGYIVTITIEQGWALYLRQNKKCALTGLEIDFKRRGFGNKKTASLDRIDSKKGYTLENCQWVHKDINTMKNDFSQEQFIAYCKLISDHHIG